MKSLTATRQIERVPSKAQAEESEALNTSSYQFGMSSYQMGMKSYQIQIPKGVSAPGLETILMVERALAKSEYGELTLAQLKRELPRQVNHNTLKLALEYLEKSGKIGVGVKGITWLGDTITPAAAHVMAHGRRV